MQVLNQLPHEPEPAIERGTSAVRADGVVDDGRVGRELGAVRVWSAGLVLLCLAALVLFFRHIDATLPYPQHADEGFISGPAASIVTTGNLRPHRFNYPSLPTYLAAGAMGVGFLRSAQRLEVREVGHIGRLSYPYYENATVMRAARQAFALLAVLCLAMTGLSAWLAFRKPVTIVLAPLLLLASPLFFRHAWTYLNVDIVGASFVSMALAACLLGTRRPSLPQSSLVPGILAGLAAASKYTLALVLLPVLVAVGLARPRVRALSASVLALVAMVAAFLGAVPYSVIDLPGFLNGLGDEAVHYASGHAGYGGEPGLEQLLFYGRHFLSEFGYGAAIVAAVGIVAFARADWRRAAVLTIFPVAMLWFLSMQRVHFTRNALAIHPFIALFAAFGFATAYERGVAFSSRRGWTARKAPVPLVVGVLLLAVTVPSWHLAGHLRSHTDSRNRARAWIRQNVSPDRAIVVPIELGLDTRGLDARGRVVKQVELRTAGDSAALYALLTDVPAPAVILVPHWGADRRTPGQREADKLNKLGAQWPVLATFGQNDVLVNYTFPTAWGDPAFAVATLR
jgi:4-amino-4-deoxy-L-arabinose transferase-like glycosyltransferase